MNQLFDFIKGQAENFLSQDANIDNSQSDQVYAEAENAIANGLKNMDAGQLEMLTQAVQSGDLNENNPQVQGLTNQFMDGITSKLGINSTTAKALATTIIPLILSKLLSNKTSSSTTGGGFLDNILGGILGGNTPTGNSNVQNSGGGLLDNLSKMGAQFGLDKDGDGDVDLDDLKKLI